MRRIVCQFSFFCMAVFIFVLSQNTLCQAKEVSVELVWKLGQVGWAEIDAAAGSYELIVGKTNYEFPAGSALQVGWGGWTPVLGLNHKEFKVVNPSTIELKEVNQGSLRIKTLDGQNFVYRGSLGLNWQDGHWKIINTLDSEDYLKGVVPIEMSNNWALKGLEGLKAQAVAARTFLVKHTDYGQKTITDSPDIDQAYGGKNVEGEASAAVEGTRGEILVDAQSSKPIEALYSSHSGGYTEDAKNVWGKTDSHNLSHPDPYSEGVGGAAGHWHFMISAPLLGAAFGLGPVCSLEFEKFPSGRVKSVRMEDMFGQTRQITGRTFVKTFYPFGQPIQSDAFLGSLFDVQKIPSGQEENDPSGSDVFLTTRSFLKKITESQGDQGPLLAKIRSSSLGTSDEAQPYGTFIFEGRGWGHGVGMSQWGAYHMAQSGYNYREILLFYYCNTLIQRKYE